MIEGTWSGGPFVGRVRLDLAYDGAGFRGWSAQPGLRTVQGVLAEAIHRHPVAALVAGMPTCAGRTDAGVHARGQVAHLDLYAPEPGPDTAGPPSHIEMPPAPVDAAKLAAAAGRWRRALPPDLSLLSATVVSADFDARFAALWRRYVYRVVDSPGGADPLLRGFVLSHPRPLDPQLLTRGALGLLGEHDFAAFCRRKPGGTTIRRLLECSAQRIADGVVEITFRADAFCQQMVRSLVGALLPVGDGSRDPGWPGQLLAAAVRAPVQLAPPHGLCLEEVGYPEPDQLRARTGVTRSVRTLVDGSGTVGAGA